MKVKTLFALVLLFLLIFGGQAVAQEDLVREEVPVIIEIPLLQKLEVQEELNLHSAEVLDDTQILFSDVLRVEVMSNASWLLKVDNRIFSQLEILIRREGEDKWQNLNEDNVHFRGPGGTDEFNLELKVKSEIGVDPEKVISFLRQQVQLNFVLCVE